MTRKNLEINRSLLSLWLDYFILSTKARPEMGFSVTNIVFEVRKVLVKHIETIKYEIDK